MNPEEVVLQKLAQFKRELRSLSKNEMIRSYVAQYAETVKLSVQIDKLKKQIKALQPETGASND